MATNAAAELRAYEAYVAEMARLADGTVILNHTLEHATIILAQIFKTSKQSVKLLSGKLDAQAYGTPRVCEAAVEFLRSNPTATIQVATEVPVDGANPFVHAITAEPMLADRLEMRVEPVELVSTFHFAVGDVRHFRFEAEKAKCEAFVKFGDERLAAKLVANFDRLFDHSRELAAA